MGDGEEEVVVVAVVEEEAPPGSWVVYDSCRTFFARRRDRSRQSSVCKHAATSYPDIFTQSTILLSLGFDAISVCVELEFLWSLLSKTW